MLRVILPAIHCYCLMWYAPVVLLLLPLCVFVCVSGAFRYRLHPAHPTTPFPQEITFQEQCTYWLSQLVSICLLCRSTRRAAASAASQAMSRAQWRIPGRGPVEHRVCLLLARGHHCPGDRFHRGMIKAFLSEGSAAFAATEVRWLPRSIILSQSSFYLSSFFVFQGKSMHTCISVSSVSVSIICLSVAVSVCLISLSLSLSLSLSIGLFLCLCLSVSPPPLYPSHHHASGKNN